MVKHNIRQLRIQKQMYRLAQLTLRNDLPKTYFDASQSAIYIQCRSCVGIKLYDVKLTINFPDSYPMEPASIDIQETGRTQREVSARYPQKQLEQVKNWNVSVFVADIVQELIRNIKRKVANDSLSVKYERPFKIIRDYRHIQQEQCNKHKKIGSVLYKNGILSFGKKKIHKSHRREENIQTKNLNRHFRSKLREILRQLRTSEADDLYNYFRPNCVGFKEIRNVLREKWFNDILKQELQNGNFLRRIEQSVMGLESKHLMIKYYPIIEHAVNYPDQFERWKY